MPKKVDHEQYRRFLAGVSFDLFGRYGYTAVTIKQIAAEAGVSTGLLYHYFPNKEAIFNHLIEALSEEDLQQLGPTLPTESTLGERVEALFRFVETYEGHLLRQLFVLVSSCREAERKQTPVEPAVAEMANRLYEWVDSFLECDDPGMTILVLCLVHGLIIQRQLNGDRTSIAAQAELLSYLVEPYAAQLESLTGDRLGAKNR